MSDNKYGIFGSGPEELSEHPEIWIDKIPWPCPQLVNGRVIVYPPLSEEGPTNIGHRYYSGTWDPEDLELLPEKIRSHAEAAWENYQGAEKRPIESSVGRAQYDRYGRKMYQNKTRPFIIQIQASATGVLYGLSDDGILYQLDNAKWRRVT